MKIIKSTETIKKIRPTCTVTDYPLENKNIDLAVSEIKGRYPESGYCMNEKCDEVVYILDGEVILAKKGGNPIILNAGDVVVLDKGEIYLWKGNCKMIISCSPPWNASQYKLIWN